MKLINFFLYLISFIYRAGLFLHKKFTRCRDAGIKTVSVGNITAGGTGKTPVVINIMSKLKKEDKLNDVGLLSRGYGRKSKGHKKITGMPGYEDVGDEVKLIKKKFPEVPVFIGKNRFKSAKEASRIGVKKIILDDGFQSWELKRDTDIVVIDATDPFGGGKLIPAGKLREPVSALKRADAVVINRSDSVNEKKIRYIGDKVWEFNKDVPLFFAVERLEGFKEIGGRRTAGAEHFKNKKILALSAIGNPEAFYRLLNNAGLYIGKKLEYRDHYEWDQKELLQISRMAYEESLEIVTTEKDGARFDNDNTLQGWETVMKVEIKKDEKWKNFIKENI